jgi:hypothetical protein
MKNFAEIHSLLGSKDITTKHYNTHIVAAQWKGEKAFQVNSLLHVTWKKRNIYTDLELQWKKIKSVKQDSAVFMLDTP